MSRQKKDRGGKRTKAETGELNGRRIATSSSTNAADKSLSERMEGISVERIYEQMQTSFRAHPYRMLSMPQTRRARFEFNEGREFERHALSIINLMPDNSQLIHRRLSEDWLTEEGCAWIATRMAPFQGHPRQREFNKHSFWNYIARTRERRVQVKPEDYAEEPVWTAYSQHEHVIDARDFARFYPTREFSRYMELTDQWLAHSGMFAPGQLSRYHWGSHRAACPACEEFFPMDTLRSGDVVAIDREGRLVRADPARGRDQNVYGISFRDSEDRMIQQIFNAGLINRDNVASLMNVIIDDVSDQASVSRPPDVKKIAEKNSIEQREVKSKKRKIELD